MDYDEIRRLVDRAVRYGLKMNGVKMHADVVGMWRLIKLGTEEILWKRGYFYNAKISVGCGVTIAGVIRSGPEDRIPFALGLYPACHLPQVESIDLNDESTVEFTAGGKKYRAIRMEAP